MNTGIEAGMIGRALVRELEQHAPDPGMNATAWPGLAIFRADDTESPIPVVYEPVVCIVANGRKRVHLGNECYNYDPLNYLVVGVPLPAEAEIVEASPEAPFLSLRLDIDAAILAELLIDAEPGPDDAPRAIYASPMHQDLSGTVIRLLKSLHDANDARVLAPLAVREVLYHVLMDRQGARLRSVAVRDSRAHRIGGVLRYMQQNFETQLTIDALAEQAFMSASTFHHNFKSMTSMSPLQYLKTIRLHHARVMMVRDGVSAGAAAEAVGYNSSSQFSREFKRVFGMPPARERSRLRDTPDDPALVLPAR